MAKNILIEKYKTTGNRHFYRVLSSENHNFYICIDTQTKVLIFSNDINFIRQNGILKLSESEILKEIPEISFVDLVVVWKQAYEALKRNNFPSSISRES